MSYYHYRVIQDSAAFSLEERVQPFLRLGYEPVGGPWYVPEEKTTHQAVAITSQSRTPGSLCDPVASRIVESLMSSFGAKGKLMLKHMRSLCDEPGESPTRSLSDELSWNTEEQEFELISSGYYEEMDDDEGLEKVMLKVFARLGVRVIVFHKNRKISNQRLIDREREKQRKINRRNLEA